MPAIGVALPNLPDVPPPLIPEYARRIEAAGFEAVWCLDRLVFGNPDPIASLAACAAVTSRVRLGTSILLAPLHSPVVLAKQLATIDLMSNGRLTLGVGVGSRPDDFIAAGVPFEHRGGRTAEAIGIMRRVWSSAQTKGSAPDRHIPTPRPASRRPIRRRRRPGHNRSERT